MKKRNLLLLLLVLLLAALPVMAEQLDAAADNNYDELIVANTTRLSGNFFGELFGNNTADADVWELLHGYTLVTWNGELGSFEPDPMVVAGKVISVGENGNRVYTIALQSDLTYSDGTPITAKDYAFAILLSAAPQIAAIGGQVNGSDAIVGMEDYRSGKTHILSGVRVLGDTMLEIEIRSEYLPFFYELGLLNYSPYPIAPITPGCEVADDGEGVYIRDIGTDVGPSTLFTAELLRGALLDPASGFVSHPSVASGPYMLKDFDRQTGEASFEINPCYKGNCESVKPTIPNLIYCTADNTDVIAKLGEGSIGLFNKAVRAETISEGLTLVTSGDTHAMSNYMRNGFSFISCSTERAAMSSQAVRQAIAHCLDADTFVSDYVRNYGMRVYGYYGIGQWMYQLVEGTLEPPVELPENPTTEEQQQYDDAIAAWDALSLDTVNHYDLDTETAKKLLEDDGWTMNKAGEAYSAEVDTVRCKLVDGELIPLELKLIYPEGNDFGEAVQAVLVDHLAQAGVQLTVEAVPFNDLLKIYYRETERDADLIYLACNFTEVFDPSAVFDPADAERGMLNRTAISDQKLHQLTVDLRQTEPGDVLGYCTKWVAFQERWAEVLPAIPVYSNVYFDIYTANLQNYNVSAEQGWATAIVPAYLGDVMEQEETEPGEDEVIFE